MSPTPLPSAAVDHARPGAPASGALSPPEPTFDHLVHLTDQHGTFAQADGVEPRRDAGYRTVDMARLLVVSVREPRPTSAVSRLAGVSLRFLGDAQSLDGAYRTRRNRDGSWDGGATIDDGWGRSLWGLGTAVARSDAEWVRQTAAVQFDRAARVRSPLARALAFAALGAAEVLAVQPDHPAARRLLTDFADGVTPPATDASWPWPEPRLGEANAALPDAMIAAGDLLDRPALVQQGLELLAWLLAHETFDGHLSVTPAGGDAAGDPRPAFDQRPIEVAALADACARAARLDDSRPWNAGVASAVGWFLGANDAALPLWDPATGGGFDGLRADGVDPDQGAEATLALLSTLQHARHPVAATP